MSDIIDVAASDLGWRSTGLVCDHYEWFRSAIFYSGFPRTFEQNLGLYAPMQRQVGVIHFFADGEERGRDQAGD